MVLHGDRILSVAPHAERFLVPLLAQMHRCGIETLPRAAIFLGQIHVESNGFREVRESLNYSVEGLLKTFGRHRISQEQCFAYGRRTGRPADQQAIANILYGGRFGERELGNVERGDGWKFIGRGLKQLTGRDNYTRFSRQWLGGDDAVERPELLEAPEGAVASATWFWSSNRLNALADTGDVQAVTRVVNKGLLKLDERRMWARRYEAALR